MTSTLITNIGQLVTNDPTHDGTKLGLIKDGALLIEDGVIAWAGPTNDAPTHHIKKVQPFQAAENKAPQLDRLSSQRWIKVKKKVRESLKEKNLAMVNYSSDANGSFLRLILAHPYLQTNHVKQILQWALEIE